MKIVLEIPGELTDEEREAIRQLLRDAFGEFISARDEGYLDEPASTLHYINKRYPQMQGLERERKIDEVMFRKQLARKLRRAADSVKIED